MFVVFFGSFFILNLMMAVLWDKYSGAMEANAIAGRTRLVFGDRTLIVRAGTQDSAAMVVEAGGLITRFGMWTSVWAPDPDGAIEALERGRNAIKGDAATRSDESA